MVVLKMSVRSLICVEIGFRTRGLLYSSGQTLGIPSTITPLGQRYQSPPSSIPGDRDLGRGPSHQLTCLNVETRMARDSPKSVVRVIRGVAGRAASGGTLAPEPPRATRRPS